MQISELNIPGKKKRKRLGRGPGSGHGKTSGRGTKGGKARSGFKHKHAFEGGQMPLHRRLPKRGFSNEPFKKEFAVINVGRLEQLEGVEFSPEQLVAAGVVKKLGDGLKVLGAGELTRAIRVEAHQFSKSAIEKIQAAGGTATVIGAPAS